MTVEKPDDTDRAPRPFAEFVVQQRRGALNSEAAEKLAELVAAVTELGKAGQLTIVVKVAPGKGDSLEVTDDVRVKLPEPDRATALWFADGDHNLTRLNPAQQPLPAMQAVRNEPEEIDTEASNA